MQQFYQGRLSSLLLNTSSDREPIAFQCHSFSLGTLLINNCRPFCKVVLISLPCGDHQNKTPSHFFTSWKTAIGVKVGALSPLPFFLAYVSRESPCLEKQAFKLSFRLLHIKHLGYSIWEGNLNSLPVFKARFTYNTQLGDRK